DVVPDLPPGDGVPAGHKAGSRTSELGVSRRHICFAPRVSWPRLSRDGRPEGSLPAFAAGPCRRVAQPLSGPLPAGVRLLPPPLPAAPSAPLAVRCPSREGYGFTTFRRCHGAG